MKKNVLFIIYLESKIIRAMTKITMKKVIIIDN